MLTDSPSAVESTLVLEPEVRRKLKSAVRGSVLMPGDEDYHSARCVYNGMIDRRPSLIIRCAGVSDVLTAVRLARDNGCPPAVRGGGHSAAGFGVCDGGLMIDLSPMKGIHVDLVQQTARAQAGVLWGELDHETQAFGLATTGARISTTGISGVTLGGGYGWLMRKFGLTIDNLLSVNIVTADGDFMVANASENADLFWGIRGGGGNFGIVTSFEYRLHAVGPMITGGMAFYPINRAREILYFYREFMDSAPDELSTLLNFLITPPAPFVPQHLRGVPVVAIAVCHAGSVEDAGRDLAPLRRIGPPLIDQIKPRPYKSLQRLFDAAGVFGYQVYGKSGHLAELSDDVIETLVTYAPQVTSPLSIVMISTLGGAVGRVGEHDTAFSHRQTRFDYAINSVWTDPLESERHISWARDFGRAMRPLTTGVYVNELGDEGEERVREAYNPKTYARLAALKKTYDPENLFRLNQNIKPGNR
jgi:FAD/FMN-containing dehydrogenase